MLSPENIIPSSNMSFYQLNATQIGATVSPPEGQESCSDASEDIITMKQFYACLGGFLLAGFFLHLASLFYSGCSLQHIKFTDSQTQQQGSKVPPSNTLKTSPPSRRWPPLLLALFFLAFLVVFFAAVEETFGAFLAVFSAHGLKWDRKRINDLISVFWASVAAVRLVATVTSFRVPTRALLGVCVTLTPVAVTFLTLTLTIE